MTSLDLLIYEATRTIARGEAGIYHITSEHTFHRFEPIPNEDFSWDDGLGRAKVRGGEEPAYSVRIPAGEMFTKDVGSGTIRTFLRIPEKKALDGVEVIFAVRFRQYGFEQLPLAGGRTIELEPDDAVELMARRPSKTPVPAPPSTPPPVVAPPAPRSPARPTVGQVVDAYKRLDRPVTHSGRTAQASLFGDDEDDVPAPTLRSRRRVEVLG